MNNTIPFRCQVKNTNPVSPLGLRVRIDGVVVFDQLIDQECTVTAEVEDEVDASCCLELELYGKTSDHTEISETGEILQDVMLNISDIAIDDLDITAVVINKSVYEHDFNGSQPRIQDQFFGNMGCNGVVKFEFTTPFYLWLLENL